ncbi:MAG TPA: hypothetical protein VF475_09785 [Sphingobium sp.]
MRSVPALSIAREAAISFAINAVLSLVFFLALFGRAEGVLHWGAPDALAMDFLPQSLAVSLMSALVPTLIVRRRMVRTDIAVGTILRTAAAFAVGGLIVGGVLAGAAQGLALPPIDWWSALTLKLLYGGMLGAMITTMALGRMMR